METTTRSDALARAERAVLGEIWSSDEAYKNLVHLCDYRRPTRSWNDRVLPGDGVVDLPAVFAALREGGYDSWFDLEVFSDDGRWGNDFPDSVWKLLWLEQARRGYEGLMRAWDASYGGSEQRA